MKKSDEELINSLSDKVGKPGYRDLMRKRSAGLSVDVLQQHSQTSRRPRYALIGAIASIATVIILVVGPLFTTSEQPTPVASSDNGIAQVDTEEFASTYIDEIVTEETIDALIPTTSTAPRAYASTALITQDDIDKLLEDL